MHNMKLHYEPLSFLGSTYRKKGISLVFGEYLVTFLVCCKACNLKMTQNMFIKHWLRLVKTISFFFYFLMTPVMRWCRAVYVTASQGSASSGETPVTASLTTALYAQQCIRCIRWRLQILPIGSAENLSSDLDGSKLTSLVKATINMMTGIKFLALVLDET